MFGENTSHGLMSNAFSSIKSENSQNKINSESFQKPAVASGMFLYHNTYIRYYNKRPKDIRPKVKKAE